MGAAVYLRKGSGKAGCVRSDDGNDLLDAVFPEKTDPEELSGRLDGIAGIVGHSLQNRGRRDCREGGRNGRSDPQRTARHAQTGQVKADGSGCAGDGMNFVECI